MSDQGQNRFRHLPRLVVRRAWAEFGAGLSGDLREDCLVLAELALHAALPRLGEVKPEKQVAYVIACIHHEVDSFLLARRDEREAVCFLEELSPAAREAAEAGDAEDATAAAALAGLPLWEQVTDPLTFSALMSLRRSDRELLDWQIRLELTDAEIAALLGSTPAGVQRHRSRVIEHLRELSAAAGGGVGGSLTGCS